MLSLEEAAEMLGYSVKGLRKIVLRSKAKAQGARTRGPTIKFLQAGKGSPIKFREEWIEEFIDQYTVDPTTAEVTPERRQRASLRNYFNV